MNSRKAVFLILFVGLLVVALVIACAEKEEPTQVPTSPPMVSGAELLQERCAACHGLNQVHRATKTQAQWEVTVDRMREYGAQLTDDEAQILIEYLADNYGP